MNKIESQKVLRYAKKIKAIKYLGGSCKICNELNIFKLTFHHRDPNEKEFQFSVSGKDKRWSIIKSELDKLLYQNKFSKSFPKQDTVEDIGLNITIFFGNYHTYEVPIYCQIWYEQ